MRITFLLLTSLLLLACGNPTENAEEKSMGIHQEDRTPETLDTTATASLKAEAAAFNPTGHYEEGENYLKVLMQVDGSLKVELYVEYEENGHSGFLEGEIDFDPTDNSATYKAIDEDSGETCEVRFEFEDKDVIIKQLQGSDLVCSLGNGVTVDGMLPKVNGKQPKFS